LVRILVLEVQLLIL